MNEHLSSPSIAEIAGWLRVLHEPGGVVEFRALGIRDKPDTKYPPYTAAGYFDYDHLDRMAAACLTWSTAAEGVYMTINPVDPGLLALACNKVVARPRSTANDDHILRRRWLVVDADPARLSTLTGKPLPPGISSTDAEKALAGERLDVVVRDLTGRGWPEPIRNDSGNGYHAWYRIDLPADDGGLVERVLKALGARHTDARVKIDTSLFNPSRVIKLYGSLAAKGDATPDRPHRRSRVLSVPPAVQVVSRELLENLAREAPAPEPPRHEREAAAPGRSSLVVRAGGVSLADRARAYVFAPSFPDSIEGQNGHGRLYHVASVLVDGFGLDYSEAMPIFRDWNAAKARPPESEKQLEHKLSDAIRNHPAPSLKLLNAERDGSGAGASGPARVAVGPAPWPPLTLAEMPAAPPWPLDVFPDPVARFVSEVTESIGCAPDLPALQCLAVASGVIGRSTSLLLKPGYFARASIYAAAVGPVSDGKSPALTLAMGPVEQIDRTLDDAYRAALAEWEASGGEDEKGRGRKPAGAPPTPRRIDVENFTLEKLFEILADNPRGILSRHDELAGLLGGLNQYKAGGKGNDREHLISAWNGAAFKLDRKVLGAPPLRVPHPCLSIIGGIQDTRLSRLGFDAGDGLVERFVFAYPEPRPVPDWSDRGVDDAVRADWDDVVSKLWALQLAVKDGKSVPHVACLTGPGKAAWVEGYNAHVAEMNAADALPAYRGAWGKQREYPGRFALVLALLWRAARANVVVGEPEGPWRITAGEGVAGAEGLTVTREDVHRAWDLAGYFKAQFRRVYREATGGGLGRDARAVLDWVRRHGRAEFREVDVKDHLRRFYADPLSLHKALSELESVGAIRPAARSVGSGSGRHPSRTYEVHPELIRGSGNSENSANPPADGPSTAPEGPIPEFSEFSEAPYEDGADPAPSSTADGDTAADRPADPWEEVGEWAA